MGQQVKLQKLEKKNLLGEDFSKIQKVNQ